MLNCNIYELRVLTWKKSDSPPKLDDRITSWDTGKRYEVIRVDDNVNADFVTLYLVRVN